MRSGWRPPDQSIVEETHGHQQPQKERVSQNVWPNRAFQNKSRNNRNRNPEDLSRTMEKLPEGPNNVCLLSWHHRTYEEKEVVLNGLQDFSNVDGTWGLCDETVVLWPDVSRVLQVWDSGRISKTFYNAASPPQKRMERNLKRYKKITLKWAVKQGHISKKNSFQVQKFQPKSIQANQG